MDTEKQTFDELPIGVTKNNTMLEEYPPGTPYLSLFIIRFRPQ